MFTVWNTCPYLDPPFPTPSHGPPLAHKTLNIKLRPQKLASVSVAVSQIQQKNGAQTALDVESREAAQFFGGLNVSRAWGNRAAEKKTKPKLDIFLCREFFQNM